MPLSNNKPFTHGDALLVTQWIGRMISDEVLSIRDMYGANDEMAAKQVRDLLVFRDRLNNQIAGRDAIIGLTKRDMESGRYLDQVTRAIDDSTAMLKSSGDQAFRSDALLQDLSRLSQGLKEDFPSYRKGQSIKAENAYLQEVEAHDDKPSGKGAPVGRLEMFRRQLQRVTDTITLNALDRFKMNDNLTPDAVRAVFDQGFSMRNEIEGVIGRTYDRELAAYEKADRGEMTNAELRDVIERSDRDMRGDVYVTITHDKKDNLLQKDFESFVFRMHSLMGMMLDRELTGIDDRADLDLSQGGEQDNVLSANRPMKMNHELPDPSGFSGHPTSSKDSGLSP